MADQTVPVRYPNTTATTDGAIPASRRIPKRRTLVRPRPVQPKRSGTLTITMKRQRTAGSVNVNEETSMSSATSLPNDQPSPQTTVAELRQQYGPHFAAGYGDQDTLGELLGRAGVPTLEEYLKQGKRD